MSLIKWSIRERDRLTAANTLTGELRGSAGQLLLYPLSVEPDDPLAPDLDNRHASLSGLANDVPRRVRVTFYVYAPSQKKSPVISARSRSVSGMSSWTRSARSSGTAFSRSAGVSPSEARPRFATYEKGEAHKRQGGDLLKR
jgi:hypothetical protein